MKKIMTVFLSALIIVCSVTCVLIAPASAATNLWSDISADDWYTRQVHTQVSDPLTLEEKKMTDVYPEKFTYTSNGSFSLEEAGSKHYYVKLPQLTANANYELSFNYSVTAADESKTPTLHKALLVPESALSNALCWNGFGAMMSSRSFLGVYDIFVNQALSADTLSDTVTYNFTTTEGSQYYLFLAFNNISTVTYSNFKVIDPNDTSSDDEEEVNPAEVWTDLSVDDWYTRDIDGESPYTDGRDIPEKTASERYGADFTYNAEAESYNLKKADGRHYYIKMPVLTANKDYTLSFDYSVTPLEGENVKSPQIYKVLLVPKSAFTDVNCWQKTTGEIFADRTWIGIQNIVGGKTPGAVELTPETYNDTLSYDFNTGKYTDYYLYIMFNNITEITYSNFSLIDPELVVEDDEQQPEDEPDEEFEVLPEDTADLWTEYSLSDWYTRDIDGETYEDGRDIPQKTVTEKYGSDFTYNETTKSFKVKNAHGRHYYVKLPKLEASKNYTLSFDYITTLNENTEGKFYKAILVPEDQFESEFCWQNTTGEIFSDRHFIDIQDIVGGKDDGLAPEGIVLTEENRKGNITYNFNSGKYTEYYLFLMFNNVRTVTYYNLAVIDPTLREDYEGSYLNYGTITPETLDKTVKAGDEVSFTATPFKGNSFEGWYDWAGNLLSVDKTFTYTVPSNLQMPKPKFISGTPAVENASLEDSAKGLLAYHSKNDNYNKVIVDDNYDVEYIGTPFWEVNIQAHTEHARTGTKSVKIQTQSAYSGRHFKGLEKNTDYAISFWAYIDKESGLSLNSIVLPMGEKPYKQNDEGKYTDYPTAEALGVAERTATATSQWQEVIVKFNSGDNTDVTLWFISRGANSDRCWVDDFAIFKPVNLEVIADLGGEVSATESGTIVKGTEVTVTATPSKGNTFKHWLDENGNVVSNDAVYTVTVDTDTYLKAVFGGYNKPARELFALNGQDGTFETGTISGFFAADPTYPDSLGHCKWGVVDTEAYEGSKSLAVTSYYRNTVLPLTGLNKNTDYKFSYYIKYPYKGEAVDWNNINIMAICGANDTDHDTAETVYVQANSQISGDSGWNKVDLYFNTGEATAVNFILRYAGEPSYAPPVYMDNVTLYEYYSNNELINGEIKGNSAPWLGDGVWGEGDVLELAQTGNTAYQTVAFKTAQKYKVTFRAKGNIMAAVSDVSATVPSVLNTLSSESYITGSSADWKEYSFDFYTGIHKGVNLMFSSVNGTAYVDDVVVTAYASPVGGVIENIDFETERFELTNSDSDVYEIYTAASSKDANVHSGTKSLHFKYSDEKKDITSILDEAFLSYGTIKNNSYRLTLYYKLSANSSLHIAPSYPAVYHGGNYADYSGELGTKHSGSGWTKLEYTFTALEYGVVKTAIKNILGITNCDFYIDDITVEVAPFLVTDPNTDKGYCSDFYSVIKNPSFEEEPATKGWAGLPASAKVITADDADSGDNYLRLTAGTKYIMPLTLNASEIYYFGASIRSIDGGRGRISVVATVSPQMIYYVDSNDNPASFVAAETESWKHGAFGFRAAPSGESYLVIECTKGTIDVDTISLCLEKFTYTENPNRYYDIIPFDYDNIDPAMIVYNGGFDENGNIIGGSPATGDSLLAVAIIMFTAVISMAALLVFGKQKGGNKNVK